MTRAASVQMSYELKIHNHHRCSDQHFSGVGKSRLRSLKFDLSSHAVRQDGWSIHLFNSVRGSVSPVSTRCNIFLCRSVLAPGGGNEIPIVKSMAMVLARSCNALHGNPLVRRLIPAVGIIAFGAWGLGPLMRLGRVIFLQRTDGSWKKSRTHYVMNSYLQPLLLWSGAILMCRALDPVALPSEASQAVKQRFLNFVRSMSTVLAFAYCLSSLIQQAQKFFMETNESNDARNMGFSFAGKAVYTAIWVAAVSLFMELLGFSTQKWLTAGGLGTVLLTLAGREIFTNFLSSVMIHATRPFVVNEWIQTKIDGYEVSGTVEHVGWWSPTIIRGDDREAVHIPNHKFTVNVVRNLSQKTHWRIKNYLAICHLDVNKINNIVADMRKVLAKNPQIEQQKLHRRVFLENINPENQALMILVSCFVKTSHFEEYLCVKEAILQDLLRVISHHRARLATPIRTVQKIYNEAEIENVPFADIIFTRASTRRPPMLIEPSYKIKDDDKVKASPHSVLTNEGKDLKAEAVSSSKPKAGPKAGSASNVDSKRDKVTAASSSNPSASFGAPAIPVNEPQTGGLVPETPVQNVTGEHRNESIVGTQEKRGQSSSDLIPTLEVSEMSLIANSESASVKSDAPPAISQVKVDTEKPVASASATRPPLEDNIVLGVALDGSKWSLPVDEEVDSSPVPLEPKELATHRKGGGSPSLNQGNGQASVAPGAALGD